MASSVMLQGTESLGRRLSALPNRVTAGVKVTGPAAAYALVWEFGRVDVNPGPKTLHSTNALGESRVLTIQAPHGYVRVNRRQYQRYLVREIKQVQWNKQNWLRQLKAAVTAAAEASRQLIAQTAPVDSGQLRESLQVVKPGNNLLQTGVDTELVHAA